jgi:hypothetical protein
MKHGLNLVTKKKNSLRKKQGRRFCQQIQLVRDTPLEPKFMGGL